MAEYIEKEAAILALLDKGQCSHRYRLGEIWELNFGEIREAIATIPAADVRENVRGRWIRKHDDTCYWWECSHCGNRQPLNRWRQEWESPFCPNCGAQMGGAEDG